MYMYRYVGIFISVGKSHLERYYWY